FAVMLIPALAIFFCSGTVDFAQSVVRHSILFVVVLGLFGTGIANLMFYRLIQISSPVFATQVTYLIPIVACCWGFIYGERLAPMQLAGALVILTGVYLSGRK